MHAGEDPDVAAGLAHRVDQPDVLLAQVHVLAPETRTREEWGALSRTRLT